DVLAAIDDEEVAMMFDNNGAGGIGIVGGVIDNLADHWKHILDFLKIIVPRYDAMIAESESTSGTGGVVEMAASPPLDREQLLNRRMLALADYYDRVRPEQPVIIAGSTGSRASTRSLMRSVLQLKNGMVILPGFDKEMEDDVWKFLAAAFDGAENNNKKESRPSALFISSAMVHPQRTMVHLLQWLRVPRQAVQYFHAEAVPDAIAARQKLLAEIFLPPIKNWLARADEKLPAIITTAMQAVTILTLHDREDEARMIALVIKKQLVENNKTIAVVTRDRQLVRQLRLVLQTMGVEVEDSAGTPFWQTPLGIFIFIASHFFSHINQRHLKSLLLHPWTMPGDIKKSASATSSDEKNAARQFASFLVVEVLPRLRGPLTAEKLQAAITTPDDDRQTKPDAKDIAFRQAVTNWLSPIYDLLNKKDHHQPKPITQWLQEFMVFVQAITAAAPQDIFAGDAGKKLQIIIDGLISDHQAVGGVDNFLMTRVDFHDWFYELLVDETLHRPFLQIPRLNIVGPLESRLLKLDITILASLSEGIWPRAATPDPWLPKPIRKRWGLPSDEEKLSLAAHDFATNFLSPEVFLLSHEKENGVPLEKSRWLQRLEALLAVYHQQAIDVAMNARAAEWYGALQAYDDIEHQSPAHPIVRPAPTPPLEMRPHRLSVTQIEKWQANPFWLYGNKILSLRKPASMDDDTMAQDKGKLLHQVLKEFLWQKDKHQGREEVLLFNLCDEVLRDYQSNVASGGGAGGVAGAVFWRDLFYESCKFFWQGYQQAGIAESLVEVTGSAALPVAGYDFTLTARADRIDIHNDGHVAVVDYKTGGLPTQKKRQAGESLQLPLEGWLVQNGGFAGVRGDDSPIDLAFLQLQGRKSKSESFAASTKKDSLASDALINQAIEKLTELVKNLADANYGFIANEGEKYNDYDLLAREGEWASGIGEEEQDNNE
ncbi:MAG: double-strand break repair protein AddB, partial [Hydrotalea sp.]|nr:double-strand break repair protein AddB [Hydrotalea sp.]